HVAKTDGEGKPVVVTSPFKWVLTYAGFPPKRFRELLAERNRPPAAVHDFVLHYLLLHVVAGKQTGVLHVLDGLHFPVSPGRLPDLGDLPVTFVASSLTTVRPPD